MSLLFITDRSTQKDVGAYFFILIIMETLEYLVPYLSYGLRGENKSTKEKYYLHGIDVVQKMVYVYDGGIIPGWLNINLFMPYLRPLSDLTEEIEHNGEKCYIIDKIIHPSNVEMLGGYKEIYDTWVKDGVITHALTLGAWNTLFEHHIDVFGLIDKGLAIKK